MLHPHSDVIIMQAGVNCIKVYADGLLNAVMDFFNLFQAKNHLQGVNTFVCLNAFIVFEFTLYQ